MQGIDYVHSKLGLVFNLYPENSAGFDYSQVIKNEDIFGEEETALQKEVEKLTDELLCLKKSNDKDY